MVPDVAENVKVDEEILLVCGAIGTKFIAHDVILQIILVQLLLRFTETTVEHKLVTRRKVGLKYGIAFAINGAVLEKFVENEKPSTMQKDCKHE